MHEARLMLLTCEAARPFAERVAERLDRPLVKTKETWFACGEGKISIEEHVRRGDLYVFQSIVGPGDGRSPYDRFIMMLHAIEAAKLSDAESVTAVVPYYPGARQDKRKDGHREGISAGLFARALQEAGASRVIAVEIHNEAIGGMFDPPRCRLENLYLTQRLATWLQREGLAGDTVAAPDVGGLERARRFASVLEADLVAISKERDYSTPNKVHKSTLIGRVKGKDVLLMDDMIDTAGSVVAAVDELKTHGARHVTVACAHPVFSGPAWERLEGLAARSVAEGWRFQVVGTDSVQHKDTPDWYHAYQLHGLISKVIRHIHARESVAHAQDRATRWG
jgi:ribose-phosphate pyrophosphokinase